MAETPREPDRYEAKARTVEERAGLVLAEIEKLSRSEDKHKISSAGMIIAAALQYERNSTLERAAYLAETSASHYAAQLVANHIAAKIRALASPAAAPAAETKVCVCRYLDGAEFMGKCPAHPAPLSEPVAPALDLRCEACGDRLADEDAMHAHDRTWHGAAEAELLDRIAELEAALRELTRAATEHANAHGCSGDLGARLSDAKALLAARTSPHGAGEGT